jgi:hypothetical protein
LINFEGVNLTNSYTLWKGADPYKIVKILPDVNFTTVNFNFNSNSGTYDRICNKNECMQNFRRVFDRSESSHFCLVIDVCYKYTNITVPL